VNPVCSPVVVSWTETSVSPTSDVCEDSSRAGVAGVAGVAGEPTSVLSSGLPAVGPLEEPLTMAGLMCAVVEAGDEGAGVSTTVGVAASSLALARAASCCWRF
jgi:hypothetical protein